jgi:peptide/nickel transport system substrate-binding protein
VAGGEQGKQVAGRNVSRWQSREYDEIYKQVDQELDAVKRAALFHQAQRPRRVRQLHPAHHLPDPGRSSRRQADRALSGWDLDLWQLASWYREG